MASFDVVELSVFGVMKDFTIIGLGETYKIERAIEKIKDV